MSDKTQERRRDKSELIAQILKAGGKLGSKNAVHCPFHNDKTASAWIKKSADGYYYFKCFTCNIHHDVWGLDAHNSGKDVRELLKEFGSEPPTPQYYYPTPEAVAESLDAIAVESIDPYTDPETGNIDLLVIRYLPRDGQKKLFSQSHQTPKGFIKKRPAGLLPLFNRIRLLDSDTCLYVEGELCVRALTRLGFTATTGSGGSSNSAAHDYSPLAGKIVFIWPDFDVPGQNYAEQVRDKLLELDPVPTVYLINASQLELPLGGDVVDLIEKVKAEGGGVEDCKIQVELIMAEANESNRLGSLETLLDEMRSGEYTNLAIPDFPILTNEARSLLNKKITIIYGNSGYGKSLFVGKLCDDLAIKDYKVARLQLEDELELHLLRSFAQQAEKSALASAEWHQQNPDFSRELYQEYKVTLDCIASTVISGEDSDWDVDKVLQWVERMLQNGKELIIVDPISVVMTEKIWITAHKLMWKTKKLLAQFPKGRIIYVSHPNADGEVAGGQAYKRFCHTLLVVNRFKQPKEVMLLNRHGEQENITVNSSIGIAKTRYGRGNMEEIATKLNPETLTIEELGVIVSEVKAKMVRFSGRNLDVENSKYQASL